MSMVQPNMLAYFSTAVKDLYLWPCRLRLSENMWVFGAVTERYILA
jgi:hypothetical protein